MNSSNTFVKQTLPFIRISPDQKLAVTKWWQAFETDQTRICDFFSGTTNTPMDISAWMDENLHNIDADIMWEFGPGLKKPHRLVITSEENRLLRPLVQYILSKAPEYKDWEFYEYRLSEELSETQGTMVSRTKWHDISEIKFELVESNFNKMGIILYIPPSLRHEKEEYSYHSYVLTESLLGEEILDIWIDHLSVYEKPKGSFFKRANSSGQPLSTLKESVLKSITTIKSRLPKTPYFREINSEQTKWCVIELTPSEQEYYPRKQDLCTSCFISTEEDIFNATYTGYDDFSSERFSNNNEIFLYLKIDGSAEDLNQDTFIDRTAIEDALNEALVKENLGCVIGGGTGLRYSYIDFALVKLDKAIEIIQKTLQSGNLTKKSWILFHDAVYQSQWIGVWDDSPCPESE